MFEADDKILVYPVDRESLQIIKSTANYPSIRLCRLVSPESWGHCGDSYMCADGMVEISHRYEDGLSDCSTVWIVDSWNELDFNQFIKPAIKLAFEKGKRVVCSRKISKAEKALLSDINVTYIGYSSFIKTIKRGDRVQEIRTPIVLVMSNTEFCNQFFIETAICAELRNRGYESILISSLREGIAFEQYTIPSSMFRSEYSENEKVIAMNQYIRHAEVTHKPDIIIVGVPGTAMPFHHRLSADFGIIAYEISEAVKSDFTVLLSPCGLYDVEFFEGVEKSLYGRLGVPVDVHSLSPYALDMSEASFDKHLSYLSVDDSYVQETVEKIAYEKLLNLNNERGIAFAVDKLVDKLSGGTSVYIT